MEDFMTTSEAAAHLRVKPQTMDAWASQDKGPPYFKVEGVRRYPRAELTSWLEASRGGSKTSQPSYRCSACRTPVRDDGHAVASIDRAAQGKESDWGIFHYRCTPDLPGNWYSIDTESATTWAELAGWIAHLLEKDWAHQTDLTGLLRKVGATG